MRLQRKTVFRSMLRAWFILSAVIGLGDTQPKAAPNAGPMVHGAFFALSTGDFDRLISWYRDNLGFTVDSSRTTPAGLRGALLSRQGALLEVLQLPAAKSRKDWGIPDKPESIHGILKIGFEVADLDKLFSTVKDRHLNVFFEPTKPENNPLRTFAVKDPDGNIVQFFGK